MWEKTNEEKSNLFAKRFFMALSISFLTCKGFSYDLTIVSSFSGQIEKLIWSGFNWVDNFWGDHFVELQVNLFENFFLFQTYVKDATISFLHYQVAKVQVA